MSCQTIAVEMQTARLVELDTDEMMMFMSHLFFPSGVYHVLSVVCELLVECADSGILTRSMTRTLMLEYLE